MSNAGKLMSIVSILFVIISIIFLITSIIELYQVNPDDILISVREGGCFESPEAVINIIYAGYVWKIIFWIALAIWNAFSAIANWRN